MVNDGPLYGYSGERREMVNIEELSKPGNGVLNVPHCQHVSFGFCGDCRPPKQEPSAAELHAQITALTSKLVEAKRREAIPVMTDAPLRLDLGCGNGFRRQHSGKTKEKGWTGVDIEASEGGADVVIDLGHDPWPWLDSSVDEVNCAHMFEHLKPAERIHFVNELWRVLKPGKQASLITPYWASGRAYGDLTHEWPPVSEFFFAYLDAAWRKDNAPHTKFICDFSHGITYGPAPWLQGRNPEFVQEAIRDHKEAAGDMLATLTKKA